MGSQGRTPQHVQPQMGHVQAGHSASCNTSAGGSCNCGNAKKAASGKGKKS